MSIKFGTDGTLYCNTIKYNYKQCRNMIADSCYGNESGTSVWNGVNAVVSPYAYKSYRAFACNTNYFIWQKLPALYSGHKYYFSCRYSTTNTSSVSIVLRNNGTDIAGANLFVGSTNNNKILSSKIITMTTSIAQGVADVAIWCGTTTFVYVSKFILIDLTDTFGSGNEPTKEWCDNNIREQETFVGFGCTSSAVTNSNINTAWAGSLSWQPCQVTSFSYLNLDSNWEPRDYMYMCGVNSTDSGGSAIVSGNNFTFRNNYKYYFYYEDIHDEQLIGKNTYFDFPINHNIGSQDWVTNWDFVSGGGMGGWKRLSAYGSNPSLSNGSFQGKLYLNNTGTAGTIRATALNIIEVNSPSSPFVEYNNYNSSISINDVNKEWCDRWIDGRSSPIIHIKNHQNTKIRFNTPMQEMKRTSMTTYSKAQLDGWIGLKNDNWSNIINASDLIIGKRAYIEFIVSDTGDIARFVVKVNSVSGNTVYCDDLGWSYSGGYWFEETRGYDVVCNDIEIRPEINKVIYDKTGTIKCKKLVRTQNY